MRIIKGACKGVIAATAVGLAMGNPQAVIGVPVIACASLGALSGAVERSNRRDAYQYNSSDCVEVMARLG